jgi:Long-chain fatty acid transport protein
MKKYLLSVATVLLSAPIFAGGILTNSNQSAAYMRMLARDASTSIDAIYYNPAGLTKLGNGFHFSLNNQTLFSKRTIDNGFPLLNDQKYIGDVTIPFFPGIYAAYKMDRWVFSFGFNPNSGGGTANYGKGLPSFEIPISAIPAGLNAKGIPTSAYSLDLSFDGSSVFWGSQVGASYKFTDIISAFAGVRMIYAVNTYKGEMKNISINPLYPGINPSGNFMLASVFFTQLATLANGAASSIDPLITTYGAGDQTLQEARTNNLLTDDQVTALSAGLGAAYNPAMTVSQVQSAYLANAAASTQNAAATSDQKVDVRQTGTGFTPIIGVNITPNDKINIGIKFEFKTKLELTNHTKSDVVTNMFPEGATYREDLPALLSIGVDYKILPDLKLSAGLHHYFDKNVDWDGRQNFIDNNLYELAFGMEYNVTDKFLLSAGYLYVQTGVGQGYQTDISYSLSSNSVGFGCAFMASERLTLNLGVLYTQYVQGQRTVDYPQYGINGITETYNRNNIGFGIGFDFSF